eukprot:Protomagalhaensia_sp_Gyna_25__5415@NODE_701_length_2813_cov_801_123648_g547_i0_p6_GENE_NODE_701_length_2813_cov_801_123648_g547_i0NODE_701_length_2813_cov_801_123648_g547_i0_p6_ORF_typecomplete_len130_score2_25DUF155/PF02582_14/2_8e15Hum_adeno_E3A/PF05393_11/0_17_NODE_701_length_2813_cov_801_123648_g547_i013881777
MTWRSWLMSRAVDSETQVLKDAQVLQKLADLYVKMIDINMVQKFQDVPEYFWENPEHQKLWRDIHAYLEVPSRISILNNRFTWTQQLLTSLTHSRNEARTTRITWICIIWIVVYVMTMLTKCLIERRHR